MFGEPKPDIYFDPRTASPGPPWASLHAKCVVVDDERALITPANFTDRGQTRNIEAGLLVDGAAFAGELAGQWRHLVSEGLVRKYEG
jgi:phosphatidylserine/phosphatidylglycerophosphate/cardiolipin synthase-like enzyme